MKIQFLKLWKVYLSRSFIELANEVLEIERLAEQKCYTLPSHAESMFLSIVTLGVHISDWISINNTLASMISKHSTADQAEMSFDTLQVKH